MARARRLTAWSAALQALSPSADVVQGGSSILVLGAELPSEAELARIAPPEAPSPSRGTRHEIEVVYDGPDLLAVAEHAGVDAATVARLHAATEYTAVVTGFLPGFAYLAELDPALQMSRLPSPRRRVDRGAVGVAGPLTGVYPLTSPGGWRWIGDAVDPRLFEPARVPPRRVAVLDTVRFVPRAGAPRPPDRPLRGEPARAARPSLLVLKVRSLVTVQDLGRPGRRGEGIPLGGALDPEALIAANRAVGNATGEAGIEVFAGELLVRALDDVVVSVDGASARGLRPGEELHVGCGARATRYVAVRGGIDVPRVLGSRGTLVVAGFGGLAGRPLRARDELGHGEDPGTALAGAETGEAGDRGAAAGDAALLDVRPAAEDGRLGAGALDELCRGRFSVSAARDRVGARLDGPRLPRADGDRALPDPVQPGAIQVSGDGVPIVLGPECATTGGYPVVAELTAASQAELARIAIGGSVRFRLAR